MEEAAARDVGGGGDVIERGRLEAVLEEQRHCRPGQPFARLLPLALPQPGRGRFAFDSRDLVCLRAFTATSDFTSCKFALSAQLERAAAIRNKSSPEI